MREAITTGNTIDEAIEKACEELGLPREEISIEVLETGRKKLFGSIPAKVRATVDGEEEETPVKEEPKKEAQAAKDTTPKETPKQDEKPVETPHESEKATIAVNYIKDIAKAMGIETFETNVVKRRDITVIKIDGEEASPLIGRRGETMEALAMLAGLVANNAGGDYEKINVDVNNYSEKRQKDLISLAKRVGTQVGKTGKSHTFEPMNSYERRIIHSVISEMNGVKSESFGEAQSRHIVVTSTRPNRNRNNNNNRGGRRRDGGRRDNNRDRGPREPQPPQEGRTDGKSPDAELLEKLAAEGTYGKIDL